MNNNYPRITIIMPVYNSIMTIQRSIESVITQSYQNIEFIVIDGGSTDGTVEIIKKYISKLSYFVSEKDNGIYDAMNKGISVSNGDIIYFLGSDDYLYGDTIINIVADYFKSNNDIDLIYGPVLVEYKRFNKRIISNNIFSNKNLSAGIIPSHQGIFMKRGIFHTVGQFDTFYKSSADLDILCRIIKKEFKFRQITELVAVYGSGGMSSNKNVSYYESASIIRKYYTLFNYIKFYLTKIFLEQKSKKILAYFGLTNFYYKVKLFINQKYERNIDK